MLCRSTPALEQISRSGEGPPPLVVAHSAVIKGTLCWLGGNFAEMNRRYRLDNAQWAVLEGRDSFPLPLPKRDGYGRMDKTGPSGAGREVHEVEDKGAFRLPKDGRGAPLPGSHIY